MDLEKTAPLADLLEKYRKEGRRDVVEWLRKYPRIIDELRDVLPDKIKEWGL